MDTREFLDTIYQDETGYCYVASKHPIENTDFVRQFFQWPEEKEYALAYIEKQSKAREVYYAPSLFRTKSSRKAEVKGARCYWVEFDGELPTTLGEIPEPNIKIQSSEPGHEHWYWLSEKLVLSQELDTINRALTYVLGADVSGWDASQILRPPGTRHHASGLPVGVLRYQPTIGAMIEPVGASEPPPVLEILDEKLLPKLTTVLQSNPLPSKIVNLFQQGSPNRSLGLMALGYGLAEQSFSVQEMLVVLLDADYRWGKFAHREDRIVRLSEIIVRAKLKYPDIEQDAIIGFSLLQLEEAKDEFEWIWNDFLPKQGYFLLTGPSGVGKTQFSLNAAYNFATGKEFMGSPVNCKMKLGFFSLELNLMELKRLVQIQTKGLSELERKDVEENITFYPIGEPLSLHLADERQRIEDLIVNDELDGVFFDSLGSMTEEDLLSEKIKGLMNWNDRIRQRHNCFSWIIHHHRKANGDNKKPNKLSDVYGSMFITRNVTTCICLWKGQGIEAYTLKNRFAPEQDMFHVRRTEKLLFEKVEGHAVLKNLGEPVISVDPETGKTNVKGLNFG